MNINGKVLIAAIPVDLLTGLIIQQGAGGDATKEAAKAKEIVAIVAGVQMILNGSAADGINSIATALEGSKSLTPAESLAVQNLVSLAGNNMALLSNVTTGTLMGEAEAAIVSSVLAEVNKVCSAYIAKAPGA